MSMRRRKICAVLGVLFSAVIMTIATVTAFATPFAGNNIELVDSPPLYMTFNYWVYEYTDLYGDGFSIASYVRAINAPVGETNFLAYKGSEVLGTSSAYLSCTSNEYSGVLFEHDQPTVGGNFTWYQNFDVVDFTSEIERYEYGLDYQQSFVYASEITAPLPERVDLNSVSIYASDYYVYSGTIDGNALADGTPFNVRFAIDALEYASLSVSYSLQGETEIRHYYVDDLERLWDGEYVYFNVSGSELQIPSGEVAYIHNAELRLAEGEGRPDYPHYSTLLEQFFWRNDNIEIDIQGTLLYRNNRNIDVQTHVQVYEFQNYTEWLANAVGGFLGTEIFGGITFGGILAMVIGFFGVLWFLKVFAGG